MSSLSNFENLSGSNQSFITDTGGAEFLTPLYKEIISIVQSNAKKKSILEVGDIFKRITLTRQPSRVRLAVDALEGMGYLAVFGEDIRIGKNIVGLDDEVFGLKG